MNSGPNPYINHPQNEYFIDQSFRETDTRFNPGLRENFTQAGRMTDSSNKENIMQLNNYPMSYSDAEGSLKANKRLF
jgi:hypothetical protein